MFCNFIIFRNVLNNLNYIRPYESLNNAKCPMFIIPQFLCEIDHNSGTDRDYNGETRDKPASNQGTSLTLLRSDTVQDRVTHRDNPGFKSWRHRDDRHRQYHRKYVTETYK